MISHYFKLIWNRKAHNSFLVAELALSFLIFSGVFSFVYDKYKLYSTPRGFDPENVYGIEIEDSLFLLDSLQNKPLGDVIYDNLRAISGVVAVSRSSSSLPYSGTRVSTGYLLRESSEDRVSVGEVSVDRNFANVWDVKVSKGRFFERGDELGFGSKKNIVINGKLNTILNKEKYFRQKFMETKNILGVVENFKYNGDFKQETPMVFSLINNESYTNVYSVKVKNGSGADIIPRLYTSVAQATKSNNFKVKNLMSEQKTANKSSRVPLFTILFVSVFLIVSISMGIFGILKYSLNNRVAEVGLRKAMGATATDIKKMFVGEMLALTSIALLIALFFIIQVPFVSTLPIERSSYLFGVAAGSILIFSLVFICSLLPSLKMATILPANALRDE
jgi:putative ABC transport system permease protein